MSAQVGLHLNFASLYEGPYGRNPSFTTLGNPPAASRDVLCYSPGTGVVFRVMLTSVGGCCQCAVVTAEACGSKQCLFGGVSDSMLPDRSLPTFYDRAYAAQPSAIHMLWACLAAASSHAVSFKMHVHGAMPANGTYMHAYGAMLPACQLAASTTSNRGW